MSLNMLNSKRNMIVGFDDLINNPTTRVPVILCLDVSGSMLGPSINELNEGVQQFYTAVRSDDMALYSAEIAVVTFGASVECIDNFSTLDTKEKLPELKAGGRTPMGEAVNLAMDMLEERKQMYKAGGVDYYQPWLILMTDGEPNGDPNMLKTAMKRTTDKVNEGTLTIIPIGVGPDASLDCLAGFSPEIKPLQLNGLKFKQFFAWLGKSVSVRSNNMGLGGLFTQKDIEDWKSL